MNLDINITVQPEDDPELLEIVLRSIRAFLDQLETQVDVLNIQHQPISVTWPVSIEDMPRAPGQARSRSKGELIHASPR